MPAFRFAFQGGGARFVTLLAAAKAVYDLQRDGTINIDQVAGTSAGAIAAGLLASGIDPNIYRNHLKTNGSKYLSQVLKSRNKYHTAFRVLVQGHSLYDHYQLKKFIEALLEAGAINPDITVGETSHSLSIITSDLSSRCEKIYCRSNDTKSYRLSSAIANSCSLPIIFKSIRGLNENNIVDGGIVNNLPVSHLSEGFEKSRVIAFSFENTLTEYKSGSLAEYVLSLIDTSISSNINSSIKILPESNIVRLPNIFSTMAFEEALGIGLDDHFEVAREKARISILNVVEQENRLDYKKKNGTKLSRTIDERQSAEEVYDALKREDIELDKIEVCMIMNSLRDRADPDYRTVDVMHTTYHIPISDGLSGVIPLKVFIQSNSGEIDLTASEIDIYDNNGNPINFSVLVGKVSNFSRSYNFPLYLFLKCADLKKGVEYITVRHADVIENAMPDIFDEISSGRHKDVCESVAMICSQPKYNSVEWRVHLPNNIVDDLEFLPLRRPDEKIPYGGIAKGKIVFDFQGDQRRPINYKVVQWKSDGAVYKGHAAGFDIKLKAKEQ